MSRELDLLVEGENRPRARLLLFQKRILQNRSGPGLAMVRLPHLAGKQRFAGLESIFVQYNSQNQFHQKIELLKARETFYFLVCDAQGGFRHLPLHFPLPHFACAVQQGDGLQLTRFLSSPIDKPSQGWPWCFRSCNCAAGLPTS